MKKSEQRQFSCLIFFGPKDETIWIFGVFVIAQNNKIGMVQLFKSIYPFSGMNFQDYSGKLSFAVILKNFGEMYTFFITKNAILMTP